MDPLLVLAGLEGQDLVVQILLAQELVMDLSLQVDHQGLIEQLAIDPVDQKRLESHPQDLQNRLDRPLELSPLLELLLPLQSAVVWVLPQLFPPFGASLLSSVS